MGLVYKIYSGCITTDEVLNRRACGLRWGLLGEAYIRVQIQPQHPLGEEPSSLFVEGMQAPS